MILESILIDLIALLIVIVGCLTFFLIKTLFEAIKALFEAFKLPAFCSIQTKTEEKVNWKKEGF